MSKAKLEAGKSGPSPHINPSSTAKLEDSEEGTSEHVKESTQMKSSYKSGSMALKKGKILVDLKHSGDYKAFEAAEKNASTKMLKLKDSIKTDPLSSFTPELIEGLIMSLSEMSLYRPDNPLQTLSKNMGEFSVIGFEKKDKIKDELVASGSKKPTNTLIKRPVSKESAQSSVSKVSKNSGISKGSKSSKESKSSKASGKSKVSKSSKASGKQSTVKEDSKEDEEEEGEDEGDEEGEDEGDEEGEEEGEEEEEEEEEEEKSSKAKPKKK